MYGRSLTHVMNFKIYISNYCVADCCIAPLKATNAYNALLRHVRRDVSFTISLGRGADQPIRASRVNHSSATGLRYLAARALIARWAQPGELAGSKTHGVPRGHGGEGSSEGL